MAYDLAIVGGGIGGSSLARAMAEHGARVLVIEREQQFRDRVRGEWLAPWGYDEAKSLGIDELLRRAASHELPGWDVHIGAMPLGMRDLVETTPQRLPSMSFYHPQMQEMLLQGAAAAGAEIRRGATARALKGGAEPLLAVERDGRVEEVGARLVIAADGRGSLVRQWAGFEVRRDPPRLLIAGLLFDDMTAVPPNAGHLVFNPLLGQASYLFPQGDGRVRAYVAHHDGAAPRLQAAGDVPKFVERATQTGTPAEFYADVRPAGPLATFDAADTWVDRPYRHGVALIGDAAASSDPSFGQGLSLTLRDVRVLRDQLLAQDDWDAAGRAYAAEHDRHYGAIHSVNTWFADIMVETGPKADARREAALPLLAQDPTRLPDHQLGGPDLPLDETVRRRFFGEE